MGEHGSTLEYLKNLQSKVVQLEQSLAAKEAEWEDGEKDSRSWSPAGGEKDGRDMQTGLWIENRTNPRQGSEATEERNRLQREEAWHELCKKARRELTPKELECVTYETLKKLLSLYGFDSRPIESARIELYWQELHGLRVPKPGTEPYYHFLSHSPSPKRVSASPSPSPAKQHSPKPSPKKQKPLHDPYTPRKLPRPNIEGVDAENNVRTCIRQEYVSRSPGAARGTTPHRTPSPRARVNPDTIGEGQGTPKVYRKDAPIGKADPNTIPRVKSQFYGKEEGSIQAITTREMDMQTTQGGLVNKGHKKRSEGRQGVLGSTTVGEISTRGAASSRAMVGKQWQASPSNPNVHDGRAVDLELSPRGLLNNRSRSVPAYSNPNEAGTSYITGLTMSTRTASPISMAMQQNKLRGRHVKDLGVAGSDPNGAGWMEAGGPATRKGASVLQVMAASNPNDNIGREGETRHMRARSIERIEGDKHFASLPPSNTTNNNISHIENGVATGPSALPRSHMFNSPHNKQTNDETAFLHGNRKLRSATPPGTRAGTSSHPIYGNDGDVKPTRRPCPTPDLRDGAYHSCKKQFNNTVHHVSHLAGGGVRQF